MTNYGVTTKKIFIQNYSWKICLKTGIETIQSSDELTEEQKKEGVHQFLSGMKEVFRELKEESGQGKT